MAFAPPARHLLRAKDLADARYSEPIEVADMAGAAGLSKAHFSREFRRTFGESPHHYLLTRRLERANQPSAARAARVPSCVLRTYLRPQTARFKKTTV